MEEYVIKNQKKLRLGITTGTCSAAAAQAAAIQLLLGVESHAVTLRTPKGMTVSVPVYLLEADADRVSYKVVKDSGDDPDVTNGTDVCVTVAYAKQRVREQIDGSQDRSCAFTSESFPYLTLDGGIGIGRVTKEGLEQAVGQAAINRVPRQMIFAAVADVCEKANVSEPLHITVWMPEGEALAKRTFNPKLGIEGGLSVLGTSGILEPMSEQAIVATIETEIRQLHAVGEEKILVTPGNYGQAYASEYLKLDLTKSVKSSNYIGDTIDLAIIWHEGFLAGWKYRKAGEAGGRNFQHTFQGGRWTRRNLRGACSDGGRRSEGGTGNLRLYQYRSDVGCVGTRRLAGSGDAEYPCGDRETCRRQSRRYDAVWSYCIFGEVWISGADE